MTRIAEITSDSETYFIADIAANHDGNLDRALKLIRDAAQAGANAAKFQHFEASTIVSDRGFRELGGKIAHQSTWNKSVVEVYQEASLPLSWTEVLIAECEKSGIEFFTAPYSIELIEYVEPFIPVFKIGSGDITWIEAIEKMAGYGKPMLLATGASDLIDVDRAVAALKSHGSKIVLMQCNTNYTAEESNVQHLNLNVLKSYKDRYEDVILGLSDHTSSHISVLGAVSLGARVVEKHFTDDCSRIGPDHKFSLDPIMWREMVRQTRELETALGDGIKKIEANEHKSAIVQRRAIRYRNKIAKGTVIERGHLIPLRPAPSGSIPPYEIHKFIGKVIQVDVDSDQMLTESDFSE